MSPLAPVETTLPTSNQPLSPDEVRKIDAYWRAANYLSVGQIYFLKNPLIREPLKIEHPFQPNHQEVQLECDQHHGTRSRRARNRG